MPYADGEKKWKWWLLLFSSIFSFGMSIYSFASTVESYNHLKEITDEYGDLIVHWSSQPIQDLQFVDQNDNCPAGYVEGSPTNHKKSSLETVGQWPGTKAWCECFEPDGYIYTYQYEQGSCDCGGRTNYDRGCSQQEINDGCRTSTTIRTETETWYTQSGQCHINATRAGCETDPAKKPISLDVWNGIKICYKRGGDSPLDRPPLSGDSCQGGGYRCGKGKYENGVVCARSKEECGLTDILDVPLLPGRVNVTKPSSDTEISGRPIVEFRMTMGHPCVRGDEGVKGRANNPRVADKKDVGCKKDKTDERYETWDTRVERSLYQENNIPTTGDNRICGNRPGQSQCVSQTTDTQYYDENTRVEWQLSYRREVEWRPGCESGAIAALKEHRDPLQEMTGLQYTLMVVNGIFGLGILGIFLPCLFCCQLFDKDRDLACIPGEGVDEVKNLTRLKECCGLIAKVAKFVPLILCLLVTDAIYNFFIRAGDSECSDDITNATMYDVAGEVEKVRDGNYKTLAIDITMAVYQLLMWFYACYKASKGDDEDDERKMETDEMDQM